jgi:hypothetical protein
MTYKVQEAESNFFIHGGCQPDSFDREIGIFGKYPSLERTR